MFFLEEITKIYADKLLKTLSHQDAFRKAVWVAYKRGIEDANVNAGLSPTQEQGTPAAGPPRGVDRELRTSELHPPVCAKFPYMGGPPSPKRLEGFNADVDDNNGGAAQLRPRDTVDTLFGVRPIRTRKYPRGATNCKFK